jgi:LPXTG-motif cell wall-anchored protein
MLQRSKFYWRRLRGERVTKSLGIGAVVFALVIQSFAVLQPSTAQAAVSDPNDNIVYQGAANKAALLAVYDSGRDSAGHTDIKQIYSHIGITRDDLANASEGTYYTDDFNGQIKTLGRMDWKQANRQALTIAGASTTVYTGGFLDGYNAKHYPMRALIGKRAIDGQWFAITLDCGNVVYITLPPKPVKNISVCRPGTGVITIKETDRLSTDVAADSEACKPKPVTPPVTPVENRITVCRPGTGVITIKESQRLSTDLPAADVACQPKPVVVTPVENNVTVCRPGTGVVTIKESQRLSTDLPAADAACQPKPVAVAPVVTQLPRTGTGETLVGALGLSLLAAASYFYWDSRRLLGVARL